METPRGEIYVKRDTADVSGADYSDEEINAFFDAVKSLRWTSTQRVPMWVQKEADAFARRRPRPTPEALRLHIDHAVHVARGWDHPNDHGLMFSAAVKSFYLLSWLDHLQRHEPSGEARSQLDVSLGLKVSFMPVTSKQMKSDVERERGE